MGSLFFRLIGVLIVVGAIFGAGVIVGGGFAQEAAENDAQKILMSCLPIENATALQDCLAGGGQ